MIFYMKNSAMFDSLMIIWNRMQDWSDFLWFWKFFNLMKILIDLLKFWKSAELLKINLLSVFLCLQNCIVCHFCKQFISIWKFTVDLNENKFWNKHCIILCVLKLIKECLKMFFQISVLHEFLKDIFKFILKMIFIIQFH